MLQTVSLSYTTKFHDRTKHIDIKYHAMRYFVKEGTVSFEYVSTQEMLADILTKPLDREKFEKLRNLMQIIDLSIIKDDEYNNKNNVQMESIDKNIIQNNINNTENIINAGDCWKMNKKIFIVKV